MGLGIALDSGWRRATVRAGSGAPPSGPHWTPTTLEHPTGADDADHWFRLDHRLPPGGTIEFQGIATQADIWIDGERCAESTSMFRPVEVAIPPGGGARIEVCARALELPAMRRPRWRNLLAPNEALRTVRTSLQGRVPGTGEPVVGPFRPVLLHPAGGAVRPRVRTSVEDGDGILTIGWPGVSGHVTCAGVTAALGAGPARLRIPSPDLWWPHTHGTPHLHSLVATIDGDKEPVELPAIGFRTVERIPGPGFALRINGVPVFCRGALWERGGRAALDAARDAGLNMIRVPGSALYPPGAFYDACDALGLMVWQDFMFARFDYPTDRAFLDEVRAEARHVLAATARHPCIAVLCGNDEVMQAAAMAGRPPAEWTHPIFDEVLPAEAAAARPDVPYLPGAPGGATPPFAASAPVAHYFGVGAYQRPLHEAAQVRFAAACLAFANPPDPHACRAIPGPPGSAAWAAAAPRDPAATWTFEDARDHYAATLLGADPALLRRTDPERWLATGRAAVALAMQSALATWRTSAGCGGGLVLGLQDRAPGPGWGLLDHEARPKSALHALAATCRPVQVLLHDAGMDGVLVHLINETAAAHAFRLVLRGLAPDGRVILLAEAGCDLPPRSRECLPAAALMGRFQDLAGTWRFGPPPFRALGAALHGPGGVMSESTIFPAAPLPREDLGLSVAPAPGGIRVASVRFAQFVAIDAGGSVPAIDHFHLWPGEPRHVQIGGPVAGAVTVSALNALHPAHGAA